MESEKDQQHASIYGSGEAFVGALREPSPALKPLDCPDGRGGKYVALDNRYTLHSLLPRQAWARAHQFLSARDFCRWLERYAKPLSTEIGVAEEAKLGAKVRALLSPRDLDGEQVECLVLHHPVFALWLAALSAPLSQRAFFGLLRATRQAVVDGDVILGQLGALRASVKGEFSCELDERGDIRVRGRSENRELSVSLPSTITVHTPIYRGVSDKAYAIELLLNVDVEDDGPVFSLSWPAAPLVFDEALLDLAEHLDELLNRELLEGPRFEVGVARLDRQPIGFTVAKSGVR